MRIATAAEQFPNLGGAGQGRNHFALPYLKDLGVPKDYRKSRDLET